MPAEVITARTAPPAITPVPSGAGFSSTMPEPKRPSTVCGTEVCVRLMRIRFFFADSIPLRIACGTSLALPDPKPTTAAEGSPTTTSAANDIFLPPLTTFVTRLIETTWSFNWNEPASSFFVTLGILKSRFLELQSRLTRRIGHGFDPSVINVAPAIEYSFSNAFFFRQFGNLFADPLRRRHVAAGDARIFTVVGCGSCDQSDALQVVDQLHINMIQRPVDIQPRTLRRTNYLLADTIVHPLPRLIL